MSPKDYGETNGNHFYRLWTNKVCLKVEAEYQWDDNFSSGYRKPGRDLAQSFQWNCIALLIKSDTCSQRGAQKAFYYINILFQILENEI